MGVLNVNGLRREKWKEKNKALLSYLYKNEYDIVGLNDIILHWPSLPPRDSWEECTDGTWPAKHDSIAYNTKDNVNDAWKLGGCIQIST